MLPITAVAAFQFDHFRSTAWCENMYQSMCFRVQVRPSTVDPTGNGTDADLSNVTSRTTPIVKQTVGGIALTLLAAKSAVFVKDEVGTSECHCFSLVAQPTWLLLCLPGA